MKPRKIRIEYGKTNEHGICVTEGAAPTFSWSVAARRGERQKAYRLAAACQGQDCWDTGWVESAEQSAVYAGPPLQPGEVYTLRLTLLGEDGSLSPTQTCRFCYGSLPWDAPWLCAREARSDAVVQFVLDFSCEKPVAAACLFVCGLGYHKVYLNGQDVLTEPMNPAYSEYEKRSYYTVLPALEGLLRQGKNRLGVRVAPGWRNPESICYQLVQRVAAYTGPTQMSAMLRIRYADGTIRWLTTAEGWGYRYDAISSADIFLGECYEAARRVRTWCDPETALTDLLEPAFAAAPGGQMVPQTLEPIRRQECYRARTVTEVVPGVWSVDFGQNIAGVVRLRIPPGMQTGQEIQLHHMEFLDENGRLYLPQLRNAASVDTYVAAGDGRDLEFWEPEFTYHGFRYAEVKGYPGVLCKEDITAVSFYTDVASESFFTCGSAILNQIAKLAVQTEKANIHSVLTDCPQRDERMGWMNDATARFELTPYCFDVGRLFPKVMRDCMDVQDTDGSITCTAPYAFGTRPADPVCSSYLIAAWQAWLHTGNLAGIREGYDGFVRWNQFLQSRSDNWIVTYSYYGDWAAPAYACQSEEFAVSAVTPGELMSTGYFYYNARLLARMARLLGKEADAARHAAMADSIQRAFLEKWWNPETGVVGTGSQGCQAFALWLDILPEEGRARAADCLHRDLTARQFQFTTGNLCTRYMVEMLSRFGYLEDAWQLMTREEYPSIGFMMENEATTVWERFELKKNPLMNSHNHPMHGSVALWFYKYLAGLEPLDGGWRTFAVAPHLPEKLLSASASVDTPYGAVVTRWIRRYGEVHLYLTVPHGTRAHVTLPWGGTAQVEAGVYHWSTPL